MDDAEAVRRCQDGNREAFRHLVERYKDVLYGTAYLMTENTSIAEEQVQEAFLSAWQGIGGFRNGRPVKPWLVRILVNSIVSQRRRQTIPTAPLDEATHRPAAGDTAELAERTEAQQRMRQALASLSKEHRHVVTLRYFTDLTVPQLADVLGHREGTVKSRLHRALRHLRDELRNELGE